MTLAGLFLLVAPLAKPGDAKRASEAIKKNALGVFRLVAPTGLEPVTQGSSGLCSTN